MYVAVVRLLLQVEASAEGCGGVTALLTENMSGYCPSSCLVDWRYEEMGGILCEPLAVVVDDDYDPSEDSVPEYGQGF